tara:strand:+ start:3918 stop:4955 length:1038 start_codon:yes stop_codon:yes gene_type:complete
MNRKIFITGESGTIPMAIQDIANRNSEFTIMNSHSSDLYNLNRLKVHKSFEVRKPEIDFLNRDLLFNDLEKIWEHTDIIIHSGAFVGTDFCQADPQGAIRTNVEGTKNIVDICNKYNIDLVYFSTTAIFDIDDYSSTKAITEYTKIQPNTLYGITKYAGEQIVNKLCENKKMIIRPVFGFGNYPDDLHSALTKIIYVLYYNYYMKSTKIDVLLDVNIPKSYIRVENIANVVLKAIKEEIWNKEINVGELFCNSLNWHELFNKIKVQYKSLIDDGKFIESITLNNEAINFIPSEDYLHYHNINDIKSRNLNVDVNSIGDYISIDSGIHLTCSSVIKNIEKKAFWIS